MVVAFPADVRERLALIEEFEGIPAIELVHQAVDLWSRLDADGRRVLGIAGIQLVVAQIQKGGAA